MREISRRDSLSPKYAELSHFTLLRKERRRNVQEFVNARLQPLISLPFAVLLVFISFSCLPYTIVVVVYFMLHKNEARLR